MFGELMVWAMGLVASAWGGVYTIDTKEDWEKWQVNGRVLGDEESARALSKLVRVTEDGRVELGEVVGEEINVCLDAPNYSYKRLVRPGVTRKFVGGIRQVGSGSKEDAAKVIDGDLSTYWAPDPEDDVEDWWVEIDLGRVVSAKRIRLIFAKDKVPFPEFRVFVSRGEQRYPEAKHLIINYFPVAYTKVPNDKHIFEIIFDSKEHYIATGGSLPEEGEDRAVEFCPVEEKGELLLGEAIQYLKIEFTRKADAGLAEVEVYQKGENILEGLIERGGATEGPEGSATTRMVKYLYDGFMWTDAAWISHRYDWTVDGWFKIDLGATFWVDTIRLLALPPDDDNDLMDGFKLYVSDGSETAASVGEIWRVNGRNLKWDELVDIRNTDKRWNFDITFPLRPVRYIFFHNDYGAGYYRSLAGAEAHIHEMHMFGRGRIAGITLRSPLIDLGHPWNITSVSWEGDVPEGCRILIRTRTGEVVETVRHYYTRDGKEVSKETYEGLFSFDKGPIVEEVVPVEEFWSPWSHYYRYSGEEFASPSPRRYLLIEAQLISGGPDVSPSLDAIHIHYTDPASIRLLGWVTPRRVEPGQDTWFRVHIERPSLGGSWKTKWYDRFGREISEEDWRKLPEAMRGRVVEEIWLWKDVDGNLMLKEDWEMLPDSLKADSVKVGDADVTGFDIVRIRAFPEMNFDRDSLEVWVGSEEVPARVAEADSVLVLRLSKEVFGCPVEVKFKGRIFVDGTEFKVWVGHHSKPSLWQEVDPTRREDLSVRVPDLANSDWLVNNVKLAPAVVTPNGDGTNDTLEVTFDVLRVTKPCRVVVEICDIEGRMIKKLYDRLSGSGRISEVYWDGRDEDGKLVPPGVYICKIWVGGTEGRNARMRAVTVVY